MIRRPDARFAEPTGILRLKTGGLAEATRIESAMSSPNNEPNRVAQRDEIGDTKLN